MRTVIAEEFHVVNIIPPRDINGAGANSDVFSMKAHNHATIILQLGATAGTTTVTLEACDNFTPTTTEAIAFSYYAETTAGGDTLGARTAATASGFATSANDNIFYVIEVDAAELPDGKPNLRLVLSSPGAVSVLVNAVAILSGARYAGDQSATAIA